MKNLVSETPAHIRAQIDRDAGLLRSHRTSAARARTRRAIKQSARYALQRELAEELDSKGESIPVYDQFQSAHAAPGIVVATSPQGIHILDGELATVS